jgi:hypothetical protein
LLHDETVLNKRNLSKHTVNPFFLTEKIPQDYFFTFGTHVIDRFEKQFFLVVFPYIRLQITHGFLLGGLLRRAKIPEAKNPPFSTLGGIFSHDPVREVCRRTLMPKRFGLLRGAAAFSKI